MNVPGMLSRFHSELWAMHPEAHLALGRILAERAVSPVTFEAALDDGLAAPRREGAIAVIGLHGTIVSRAGPWAGMFGLVDPQEFAHAMRLLAADSSVSDIVVSIDSPGGTVAGTGVAAAAVREAAQKKNVIAVADGMMASAAYWIGSMAREVVADPLAEVGSIGVIATHVDLTGAADKAGVKVTYFRSSPQKALGQPYEPLSEAAGEEIAMRVSAAHAEFVGSITAARGQMSEAALSGRIFTGLSAVETGLADRVASLHDVVATLAQAPTRAGVAARSAAGRKRSMEEQDNMALLEGSPEATAENPSADRLEAENQELRAELTAYKRAELAKALVAKDAETLPQEDMQVLLDRSIKAAKEAEDERAAREVVRGLITLAVERREAFAEAEKARAEVKAAKREAMARTALTASGLPKTTEELDERFNAQVISAAQAATTDANAEKAVEALIEERRALLASQGVKNKKAPQVADVGASASPEAKAQGLQEFTRARAGLGLPN